MLSADTEVELLTTTQAGQLLGVSQGAVRTAILKGRLMGSKVTGVWYVERKELFDWRQRTRHLTPRTGQPWERVASVLVEYGTATADELAQLCELHPGNVRKHLAILSKQGRVHRLPDGQWTLTASERQGAA
jgi:hypothetical protein